VDPVAFDRVVIGGPHGVRSEYSVEEFFALPLHERIEHVLKRDIAFFRGSVEVDRASALRSLRGWSLIPPKGD
jgi:hypothetical protein